MIRRVLASSRYFVATAVLGAFVASVVLIVSGVIAVAQIAWEAIRYPRVDLEEVKHLAVESIELIDIFLLGTVLYIVALGLYELFVDPELPMPSWLKIHDLDELKEKLVAVIIVLLGVTFLAAAVTWNGEEAILEFGVAVALVIAALAFMLLVTARKRRTGGE